MNLNHIERAKDIGRSGICTDEDLHTFLPNLPGLSGSGMFLINWTTAAKYLDMDVEHFVKGLHAIEMKYKAYSKKDFGFGSPSPSHKVIDSLKSKDKALAGELTRWIAQNGGNYYIESVPGKFMSGRLIVIPAAAPKRRKSIA